jgi:hypothetical protein
MQTLKDLITSDYLYAETSKEICNLFARMGDIISDKRNCFTFNIENRRNPT